MTRLKCIVVDDDPISRDILKNCIFDTPFLELIGSYSNAIEASIVMQKRDIDLVFLDVEMPEMTGLEFLQSFKDIPQVIMVTSEKKYAFEAFKFDVTDFIAKPVDKGRFKQAVERAMFYEENLIKDQKEEGIFIKSDSVMVKLMPSEILFIEALGDYVKVITPEKKHVVHSTMKAFMAKLTDDFIRIHKSYIINFNKIQKLEENTVKIATYELPVSRTNKKELKEKIERA